MHFGFFVFLDHNGVLAAVFGLVHYLIGGFKKLLKGYRLVGGYKCTDTEIYPYILAVDLDTGFSCQLSKLLAGAAQVGCGGEHHKFVPSEPARYLAGEIFFHKR